MLQQIKINGNNLKEIYVEVDNFNFHKEEVYDINLNKIEIEGKLFNRIKNLILHNLHFPTVESADYGNYSLELGEMIKTPWK